MNPQIILADEPTSSLDAETGEKIIDLLLKKNKENNTTLITVTHDINVAKCFDKVINLKEA